MINLAVFSIFNLFTIDILRWRLSFHALHTLSILSCLNFEIAVFLNLVCTIMFLPDINSFILECWIIVSVILVLYNERSKTLSMVPLINTTLARMRVCQRILQAITHGSWNITKLIAICQAKFSQSLIPRVKKLLNLLFFVISLFALLLEFLFHMFIVINIFQFLYFRLHAIMNVMVTLLLIIIIISAYFQRAIQLWQEVVWFGTAEPLIVCFFDVYFHLLIQINWKVNSCLL